MEPLVSVILGKVFDKGFDGVLRAFRQKRDVVLTHVGTHLQGVVRWSGRIQFYGMSEAHDTDSATVGLSIDSVPRRFRGPQDREEFLDEQALLQDDEHYVLLGDPGSGKTTTIKRLARILLSEAPLSECDRWQYPLVIRLRETDGQPSLHVAVSNALGVEHHVRERRGPGSMPNDELGDVYIGGVPIQIGLPELLNRSGALLLLDGLDEVDEQRRDKLVAELAHLAFKLSDAKVIVTCRSGAYVRHLDGYRVVELCPLDESQVRQIAGAWLPDPSVFLAKLAERPYRDLVDRPLFLTQLLFLFGRFGYLPEQPATVYKNITQILLKDWDYERNIRRESRYASFTPDRKFDFLCSLAYTLTYLLKTSSFTTAELIGGYRAIHQAFNLPLGEAKVVAQEIETHTGIILETGIDRYEFSHLSLQEYLCAEYIVREPFSDKLLEYLREYPAPIAVAVALSADPGNWFAALLLRQKNFAAFTEESLAVLLGRLALERPFFAPQLNVGLAVLRVLLAYPSGEHPRLRAENQRFVELPGVKELLSKVVDGWS